MSTGQDLFFLGGEATLANCLTLFYFLILLTVCTYFKCRYCSSEHRQLSKGVNFFNVQLIQQNRQENTEQYTIEQRCQKSCSSWHTEIADSLLLAGNMTKFHDESHHNIKCCGNLDFCVSLWYLN